MIITNEQIAATKRKLFGRPRGPTDPNAADFTVRPISAMWRTKGRSPAFRTAVCNVAYTNRDSSPIDRYGPMPAAFAERRAELHAAGLALPKSAPNWAREPYRIWQEADAFTASLCDMTEVSAWHVLIQIPQTIPSSGWTELVVGFVQRQLVSRGAAVAWAIHSEEGKGGSWVVAPHAHLIVSARHFRHTKKHGQRNPAWAGSWGAQSRLKHAWRRACRTAFAMQLAGWS